MENDTDGESLTASETKTAPDQRQIYNYMHTLPLENTRSNVDNHKSMKYILFVICLPFSQSAGKN